VARTPETFRREYNIEAHVLTEVNEIDVKNRRVRARRLDTEQERWEAFDQLMIAVGAVPIRPRVRDIHSEGIYGVNTLQSGIYVRRAVDEKKPSRAVIVGGGYIGIEMAEALLLRGIHVSMIDKMPQVMNTLDADMAEVVARVLRQSAVDLYLEESLEGFDTHDGRVRAVITDKRTLPAEMVILGMGVRPNSDLAKKAGIPLGVRGAIKVNDRMETEIPGIWAAGDCVESFHMVSRQPFYVALGTVANKQGRIAGINITGGQAVFPGVVGTAITKFKDLEIARTGLQQTELESLDLDYATATIESATRAGYYPSAAPITVKIMAEKCSGRLLGGQIIGNDGAGKRIDILATALHAGMTVDEMIHLDLSYAPPFAPVWDPVLIAVRQIVKQV